MGLGVLASVALQLYYQTMRIGFKKVVAYLFVSSWLYYIALEYCRNQYETYLLSSQKELITNLRSELWTIYFIYFVMLLLLITAALVIYEFSDYTPKMESVMELSGDLITVVVPHEVYKECLLVW